MTPANDRDKPGYSSTEWPALETLCEECQGEGGIDARTGWITCSKCEGAGWIPSKFGEAILDLFRHYEKMRSAQRIRDISHPHS